jgi:hypothetical protein
MTHQSPIGETSGTLVEAEHLEALDDLVAGVVLGEHLRAEEAQVDPGGLDAFSFLYARRNDDESWKMSLR